MSELMTEEQQLEVLKKFWKENGFTIIASILIAILLVTGLRFYRGYVKARAEHASIVYQKMLTDVQGGDIKDSQYQAHLLLTNYHATPYGKLSAFFLAKQFVAAKKYPLAIEQLKWVVAHAHNISFKQMAKIRLANIYIETQQPKLALDILTKIDDKTFSGLIFETQGDAYVAMKNLTQAKIAYKNALDEFQKIGMQRPLVAMKYYDLPDA